MRNSLKVSIITFIVLLILHQDWWNWDNPALIFGFLPLGLAYHAGYSVVVAIFWGVVMAEAWPTKLEDWADQMEE